MRHNNQGEKNMATARPQESDESEIRSELLDSLVGYRLRRAAVRVMGDFMTAMSDLDLRPVQFSLLAIARENPGINQSALGRSLGIQRTNLVPLIAELAGRGLVERRPSKYDRRAFAIHITAKGDELVGEAERRVRPHEERMLAGLNGRERDALRELLGRIIAE
jgi:DNA-binding MarR family transcriptional regulator